MDTIAQRRAALFRVVQFVILATVVAVAPPVGVPIALVWIFIAAGRRAHRLATLCELRAKHYTTKTRLFHSPQRPTTTGLKPGDIWVDTSEITNIMHVHNGIEFKEV
jgi:hypothetical protein